MSLSSSLSDTGSDASKGDVSNRIARALLDIEAVALRPDAPFTWTSGLAAPIYCDNRRTISYPPIRRSVRDGFVSVLRRESLSTSTIAGTATAGIPHAAWLAEAIDQPMVYVRSRSKEYGQGERIEGVLREGDSVVVVEDLISTGGSALGAVEAVQSAGASVEAVLAIFSYELDAADRAFREAGVERHVLTTFSTLLEVAYEHGHVTDKHLETLKSWRKNPEAWSLEHGGGDAHEGKRDRN